MEPRRDRRAQRQPVRRRPHWGRVGPMAGAVILMGAAVVWVLRPHPAHPAAPTTGAQHQVGGGAATAPSSDGAGPSASASTSGASASVLTLRWTKPAAVPAGAAVGAMEGPAGSVWLLTQSGRGRQLWHFGGTADLGTWPVPGGTAVTLQTVGPNHVWLGSSGSEIAFSKSAHIFQTYGGAGTVAVQTVAGHSVALDLPGSGRGAPSAAPYVEVAPLGGSARRVSLPGAAIPATVGGGVSAGPAGDALVAVDGRLWAVPVAAGPATHWATLPPGGLPAPLAWGDGGLWCVVGPASAPSGIDEVRAGTTATPLPLGGSHPPLAGTPLTFAGGHLWWVTAHHLFGYDPASGQTLEASLQPGTAAPVMTASGSGVWIAQGGEIAQADIGTQG